MHNSGLCNAVLPDVLVLCNAVTSCSQLGLDERDIAMHNSVSCNAVLPHAVSVGRSGGRRCNHV